LQISIIFDDGSKRSSNVTCPTNPQEGHVTFTISPGEPVHKTIVLHDGQLTRFRRGLDTFAD
jgi:hypothetical protein